MADVIKDIDVNDALSVGWHVVVPFSARGATANGDMKTVQMFPLTSHGRFRKPMAWAIQVMTSLGFYDSNYDNCARHLNCAPVVRDIVAAATSAKTHAVRRTTHFRYVDASGSPLPTFIEVEVRGQTLTVTTHSPVYVERSIAVVQWFVKELQADAAVTTTLDLASPVKAIRARNDIDELSALKCEGTHVKYAPASARLWLFGAADAIKRSSTSVDVCQCMSMHVEVSRRTWTYIAISRHTSTSIDRRR